MKLELGKQKEPSKDLIHGVEGVGKSSLAATYPNAIFIDCEGSTSKLDVSRLRVTNWGEFKQAIALILSKDPQFKAFESVVIDTVDWLEKIVIAEVVYQDGAKDITEHRFYGYGKGDQRVKSFFDDQVIPLLQSVMNANKNVVMVAHSVVKSFNDPIGGAYDYYGMDMGKKAAATLRQWAHNVFFVNYETKVIEGKGIDKNKAIGGKDVYLFTQRTPQYEAKRRDDLKDKIKVIEGVNPYPEIVGTEVIKKDLIENVLPGAINDLLDAMTIEDVTEQWKSYKQLHGIEEYVNAIRAKRKEIETPKPEGNAE